MVKACLSACGIAETIGRISIEPGTLLLNYKANLMVSVLPNIARYLHKAETEFIEFPVKGRHAKFIEFAVKGHNARFIEFSVKDHNAKFIEFPVKGHNVKFIEFPVKGHNAKFIEFPVKGHNARFIEFPVKGHNVKFIEFPVKGRHAKFARAARRNCAAARINSSKHRVRVRSILHAAVSNPGPETDCHV